MSEPTESLCPPVGALPPSECYSSGVVGLGPTDLRRDVRREVGGCCGSAAAVAIQYLGATVPVGVVADRRNMSRTSPSHSTVPVNRYVNRV